MERSKALQIYMKPGIREDDLMLRVWDACRRNDRPQDVFRTMLRAGLRAMYESGELPDAVIDECGLDGIFERRRGRSAKRVPDGPQQAAPAQPQAPAPAYAPAPPPHPQQPYYYPQPHYPYDPYAVRDGHPHHPAPHAAHPAPHGHQAAPAPTPAAPHAAAPAAPVPPAPRQPEPSPPARVPEPPRPAAPPPSPPANPTADGAGEKPAAGGKRIGKLM